MKNSQFIRGEMVTVATHYMTLDVFVKFLFLDENYQNELNLIV